MASVGSILPSSSSGTASGTSSGATGSPASSKAVSAAADPLANQSTFLTLLVSQLKSESDEPNGWDHLCHTARTVQ